MISNIYHFLWYFGEKTDDFLNKFKTYFKSISEEYNNEIALICSIFETFDIIELTNDWILTENGLITHKENIYEMKDKFKISIEHNIYKWSENDNNWELNLNNINSSKITIKNNWDNIDKFAYINLYIGNFVCDNFIHTDKYILNVSKDYLENPDCFDLYDIDKMTYKIYKKGSTEIYPLIFKE